MQTTPPSTTPGSLALNTLSVAKVLKVDGAVIGDGGPNQTMSKWRGLVEVATTVDVPLVGIQTIDGHLLVEGEVVLVKNQSDPIQNGVYVAGAAVWKRAVNMAVGTNVYGVAVYVSSVGLMNGNHVFVQELDAVVGTDPLAFVVTDKPTVDDFTQITSVTTNVPVTTLVGTVTTLSMTTATTATTTFAIVNAAITTTSKVFVSLVSYSGVPLTNGIPVITASAVSGSCNVSVSNYGANSLGGVLVFNYQIV